MSQPQTLGDQGPDVHHAAKLASTGQNPQCLETVHQQEAVVRCPADDKHGHQRDDEVERLPLLPTGGVAQGPEDADVAVEHDEQRHTETENHTDELEPHLPLGGVFSEPHLTQQCFLLVHGGHFDHLFESNVHSTQAEAENPDDGTG